ncbi:putative inactive DNA (cytosine-5)-methyltransferase DRM3 [Cardamine amara subsp. amara]|uniref:Inactive DNA (Cytosine-5)-methyltransferase DRM3 n=1 Tax=Cardamine amara subsp. amara TaxID=228776 RepID=A0ABD1AUY4_CARAN
MEKNPRLVVWNPYCGQTRCIKPLKSYHKWDKYALRYEENNNGNRSYKILRYLDAYECMSEICGGGNITRICEFDSNSWKVIEVNPDWKIYHSQRGVSLKGNTYWFAEEIIPENPRLRKEDKEIHSFLVCFDFTNERFGLCLSVLFDNHINDTVKLSTVREEKLAVLHQRWTTMCRRIWISNKVEPNALSWSKLFLQVGWIRELDHRSGSFFVDEEENVAVIFDKGKCRYNPTRNTAYIVRENEYIKEVDLGESVDKYCFPLVCSYVPRLSCDFFFILLWSLWTKMGDGSGGSMFPKPETLDFEFPCDTSYSGQIDNAASTSGSHVKSLLIEMGFCSTLVQKAIDENGEDDLELLVEILTKSTVTEHPEPSFHGLMEPKPEPGIEYEPDGRRMTLLAMKFPENLVDLALDRHGKDVPMDEIVDFITAAQLAEKYAEEAEDSPDGTETNEEDEDVVPVAARAPEVPNELLFETMDKTLHLLEMGFSNHEISMAIEKIGTEGQISDFAETIVTGEVPGHFPDDLEDIEKKVPVPPAANRTCLSKSWRFIGEPVGGISSSGTANMKPDPGIDSFPSSSPATVNVGETSRARGKRLKDEDEDAYPDEYTDFDDRGKRVRPEYMEESSSFMETPWMQDESKDNTYEFPSAMQPRLSQTLAPDVSKQPYFFYGNLGELSPTWWAKISSVFSGIHPEHVDTRLCSAFRRTEGYLHNLPIENRFNILPKPQLTIQDAMPQMKSWWPQWDIRKHINGGTFSSANMNDVTLLCERIGRRIAECRGKPTQQDQTLILRHCQTSNLIWIAPNILSPVEPEHLECIMGYPTNHTNIGGGRLAERLKLFDYCFQTDTLGYHLSVLKPMFPEGLTVLSIFSGIGGVEIALDRLGIRLKGVVSVDPCGLSRNILKRWWQTSGQTGELVQIEEIRSLTTKKLESLMQRFGEFDLVICQNPPAPPDLSKEASRKFDYMLFNEFARVSKLVRAMTGSS